MGKGRKKHDSKVKGKSSHLQYSRAKNSSCAASNEASSLDAPNTGKENAGSIKNSGVKASVSNRPSSSANQLSADLREKPNTLESVLQNDEVVDKASNITTKTDACGFSSSNSLAMERRSFDGSEDKQDTNNENATNEHFATINKTLNLTVEGTHEVGKQTSDIKLMHDSPISQSPNGFSELMQQFQRHTVKKVSEKQVLPDETKLSKTRQISSFSSTSILNKTAHSKSDKVSSQVTKNNNCAPNGTSHPFNLPNLSDDKNSGMSVNVESKSVDKHRNSNNQSSPNLYKNTSNAEVNELISDSQQVRENELVVEYSSSKQQSSPTDLKSTLNIAPEELTRNNRQVLAKYTNRGVQTSAASCECWNSKEFASNKKKTEQAEQSNLQRICSEDQKEFIEKENKLNSVHYSGRINLNILDSYYQLTFGYFGSENLLVIDTENYNKFVGSITIENGEELNFKEPFESNKLSLFERIVITKVLSDELLNKRNETYNAFLQTLETRSKNISNDLSCTEDFLQLLLIVRFQNLSLNKPLILLKDIIQNEFMSDEIKQEAKRLEEVEYLFYSRNQFFPKFSHTSNPNIPDLFASVRNICQEGVTNHKKNLMDKCPNKSFQLVCLVVTINRLPLRNLLYISNKDIELFSSIMELTCEKDHSGDEMFPVNFVENQWNNFYKKIQGSKPKSLKQLGPMTHPIYYFLLKILRDVIADISSKLQTPVKELISSREGELVMADIIRWPSNNPVIKSLEEQYRLILRLLKHFEPGVYSYENKFTYSFKLLKENENLSIWQTLKRKFFGSVNDFKNVSQERIVWLYIVDSGIAPILGDKSKSRFKQLSLSVITGFVKFIQETKHDRYETFRVAAHNIIKFAAQISPYFSAINCALTNVDHDILNKQIDIISCLLCSDDNDLMSDHFSDLMMIYNEYWDHRESIVGKLPIPCSIFNSDVEAVMEKLVQIVQKALLKNFRPQLTIKFLRLYNEFLKHLKGIDFTWFISKNVYFPELSEVVKEVKKNDITSYEVTEPEDFIKILEKKPKRYPKHFSIEVVKKLMDIISMSFDKEDWDDEDCVNAAGDFFLAVGHSVTHFEDQTDYTDLEHFLRDCTVPFCCVIENSSTYSEFKQRLDNVENFYLYARKQNQIGIEHALDLCEQEVNQARINGFETKINRHLLEECYNRYSKKLVSLKNLEISEILNEIENELKNIGESPLNYWTTDFKQNVLPHLLAELAAIWSLQESKDVAGIEKSIEPHCVQILCIFRLLGVDQDSTGVPKHFAQVLTGQGKSLILGLLSAIIALTGNEAFIVCYSDYLANRDEACFNPFFNTFDRFRVKNNISYNTFRKMADTALMREVNGIKMSLRTVVSDLILNKLNKRPMNTIDVPKSTVLLIDEADVFFSDQFYGQAHYPIICLGIPALLVIQPQLWRIIEDGVSEKNTILRKIKAFINELLKDEKHDDFRNFLKITSQLFEKNLEDMVDDALSVSNYMEQGDAYKIDKSGIINRKDNSDVYRSYTYFGYLNTFHYFRLKKDNFDDKCYANFGFIKVDLGRISYASLPSRYESILGVSGTLMTLNNSERNAVKNYGIDTMTAIPSFFGERKLVFEPSKNASILDLEENWLNKTFESALKNMNLKRAVLVFFESDDKLKLFANKYRSGINRLHVLTGNEEPDIMEWRINEAGVSQTVTLATRAMGRGVDYKSNDRSAEENGGVHVIQTFFSLDEKEETQIKGRTARKDNKGSYELILCREHLKILKCSINETGRPINSYVELHKARKKMADLKGAIIEENIRNSEKAHNLTIEFFESLANYSPEKRHEYFSKYPFATGE